MSECEWWYSCRRPAVTTRRDERRNVDLKCCAGCARSIDDLEADESPRARQARAAARRQRKHEGKAR